MARRNNVFYMLYSRAFTLIELLIVVAIISILAAIAVPNFLEAQTRSKVARIKADMRTLVVAVESYAVDHNTYPPRHYGSDDPESDLSHFVPDLDTKLEDMRRLTSPIAYITTLMEDVFDAGVPFPLNRIDYYDPVQTHRLVNYNNPYRLTKPKNPGYCLVSVGPDGFIGVYPNGQPGGYPPQSYAAAYSVFEVYDPTRGTISPGNVYYFMGSADPKNMLEEY